MGSSEFFSGEEEESFLLLHRTNTASTTMPQPRSSSAKRLRRGFKDKRKGTKQRSRVGAFCECVCMLYRSRAHHTHCTGRTHSPSPGAASNAVYDGLVASSFSRLKEGLLKPIVVPLKHTQVHTDAHTLHTHTLHMYMISTYSLAASTEAAERRTHALQPVAEQSHVRAGVSDHAGCAHARA